MTQVNPKEEALPRRGGAQTKGVDSLVSVMMGHQGGERSLEVSFAGIEESDAELSVRRKLT